MAPQSSAQNATYAQEDVQLQKQGLHQEEQTQNRDFYYKGWRGESGEPDDNEEDLLQLVLSQTTNGRDLHQAVQRLLEHGGDERSVTDPKTGLTKYHTPTQPCQGILRSSCTSNVPDKNAFLRGVDTLRQLLLEARNMSRQKNHTMVYASPEDLFRKLLCDIRERLRSVFELSFEDVISLFPSGTDAELMPALLAYMRAAADEARGDEVFSVVTAAGEVGSGTTMAAMGQHFAKMLPSGRSRSGGDVCVFDVDKDSTQHFTGENLFLRDSEGKLFSSQVRDEMVEETVRKAAEQMGKDGRPKYGCIVVHMVLGSKTGQCMPSSQCLDRLAAKYGHLLLPVVDACQGRLAPGIIRKWLDKGRVVLCTGSKFFGGPPFCGGCLLSEQMGKELESLLAGREAMQMVDKSKLKEYVVASLLSDDLPQMRALLPQRPLNYGVLMRWTLALHGMESFFVDVPSDERSRLMATWVQGVRGIIKDMKEPFITLLDDGGEEPSDDDHQGIALSTIVSFHCRCNKGTPVGGCSDMTMDELRHVQYLMASDLAQLSPHLSLLAPARTKCFMGQPVDLAAGSKTKNIADRHVLRVAVSAPLVVRMYNEGMDAVLAEDRALFEKLNLILGNWFTFVGNPSSL